MNKAVNRKGALRAVMVLWENGTNQTGLLLRCCRLPAGPLARSHVPWRLEVLEGLPLTPTGKVDRKRLPEVRRPAVREDTAVMIMMCCALCCNVVVLSSAATGELGAVCRHLPQCVTHTVTHVTTCPHCTRHAAALAAGTPCLYVMVLRCWPRHTGVSRGDTAQRPAATGPAGPRRRWPPRRHRSRRHRGSWPPRAVRRRWRGRAGM